MAGYSSFRAGPAHRLPAPIQPQARPDVWTNAGLNQAPTGPGQRGIMGGSDQILSSLDASMGRMGAVTPQRTQLSGSSSRLNPPPGGFTPPGFDWNNIDLPIYQAQYYPQFNDDGTRKENKGSPLPRYVLEDQWFGGDTVLGSDGIRNLPESQQLQDWQRAYAERYFNETGIRIPSMSGYGEQLGQQRQAKEQINDMTPEPGIPGQPGGPTLPEGTVGYDPAPVSDEFYDKIGGMISQNQQAQQRAETPQEKTWAWQEYYRTLTGSSLGLGLFDEALDPLARLQQQLQGEYNPNFMNSMTGDQGFGQMVAQQQRPVINQLRGRAASMGVEGAYEGLIGEQQKARDSLAAQAQAAYAPQAYQQQQQYQGATDQLLSAINQAEINAERLFATSGV